MAIYRFQIQHTGLVDVAGHDVELTDDHAAWAEASGICRDLGRDLIAKMTSNFDSNSEWQLDVLDESGVAIFRFRFTANALRRHSHG
jgi:hypothetical protein